MLSNWMRRNWRQIVMCGLLLMFAGCVKKSQVNGATVYSMEWWVTALVGGGSLAAVGMGWNLRKTDWRGWILIVFALFGLIIWAPSTLLDKTVVDANHFESRYGFWVAMSVKRVDFENLSSVNLKEKVSFRKGRKRVSYDLECQMKDGKTVTVPLNETMKEAIVDILINVKKRNIPIMGLEGIGGE